MLDLRGYYSSGAILSGEHVIRMPAFAFVPSSCISIVQFCNIRPRSQRSVQRTSREQGISPAQSTVDGDALAAAPVNGSPCPAPMATAQSIGHSDL